MIGLYTIIVIVSLAMFTETAKRRNRLDRVFTNTYASTFETKIAVLTMAQTNVSLVTMPLMVRLAMCRLAESAQGQARDEILQAFNFPKTYKYCYVEVSRIFELLGKFSVLSINKIYVNDTKDLNPLFFDKLSTERFGVHAQRLKFSRPKSQTTYINKWFDLASLKRLPDVLKEGDLTETTSILLMSAAHVKTTWATCFNVFDTKNGKFRKFDGKIIEIPMMHKKGDFLFYHHETAGFKIIAVPLTPYGMTMTFIIGDQRGSFGRLKLLLENNLALLQVARHNMRYTILELTLPRFRIKSTFSFDQALKGVGIRQIFKTTHSGLDSMLKSHHDVANMYLSLVKQKVFLDVDEAGVFRCAEEENSREKKMHEKYPLMHGRTIDFTADHPFMFSIDLQISTEGSQTQFIVGAYLGPGSEE